MILSVCIQYNVLPWFQHLRDKRKNFRKRIHGAHKPVTISNKNIEKGKIFDYNTIMKQNLIDYKDRLFKLDYEVKKLGEKTILCLNLVKFIN